MLSINLCISLVVFYTGYIISLSNTYMNEVLTNQTVAFGREPTPSCKAGQFIFAISVGCSYDFINIVFF